MKHFLLLSLAVALSLIGWQPPYANAEETGGPERVLIDLGARGVESRFLPSSDQVKVTPAAGGTGVEVRVQPGNDGYPGIKLRPDQPWDLSDFGHVRARLTNTGGKPISVSLRVDNKDDGSQSNTEGATIAPGETKDVEVIFGYAYGRKPAYKLKPEKVGGLLVFTKKTKEERSFRIESLKAGGPAGEKPPVDPKSIRTKPENGFLFGNGIEIDEEKQIATKGDAKATVEGGELKLTLPKGKGHVVTFKPAIGAWDLREAVEVRVKVRNDGQKPVTPSARTLSVPGPTDPATTSQPLAPGATGEIAISFIPAVPWKGITGSGKTHWDPERGTGTKFISDAATGVTIFVANTDADSALAVESIVAGAPPAPELPEWLGKRPPVEGDWKMTFQEEFDGAEIDASKWRIYTENYWDKRSHFSKDNVILGDGVVRLRYEKKTGHHNDDPNDKKTDYATGFLDTYGKWVQRYGYFESRMKLPTAPGLWPAFWLMPDRGVDAGPQWKRQDTKNGGMEFDIMEFLSRWGPYRYNIAWHWDGYGKGHQQTGSTTIYFQPDEEGFVTAGVLWLPGLSVYYANGEEVARWETPRMSNVESDIMFTHVTGGWDNNSIDDSELPDDFVIDYVRVWQRADLASEVDGPQSASEPVAK